MSSPAIRCASWPSPALSDEQFSALTGIDYDPAAPPLIIGALPGSRVREVQWIAPVIYRALALMEEAFAGGRRAAAAARRLAGAASGTAGRACWTRRDRPGCAT